MALQAHLEMIQDKHHKLESIINEILSLAIENVAIETVLGRVLAFQLQAGEGTPVSLLLLRAGADGAADQPCQLPP